MSKHRGTLAMSAANALGLLAGIGGYLVYSRILQPADFAVYAGSLAIAKLGTALLDGGIKITLIEQGDRLGPEEYRGAFLACSWLSVGCIALLALCLTVLLAFADLDMSTAWFLGLYATAYFATYPWLIIPLADLERNLKFPDVARAEGLTVCIEYALPALLWILIAPGFWTFLASVWLARVLRAALLMRASGHRVWLNRGIRPDWSGVRRLLGVGAQFQFAVLASMLRDNLHFVLIGPSFGREMAGMYAWALQLCGMTSQVFVQTAARVSLPALLATDTESARSQMMLRQITWLALLTFPPLLCLVFLAPAVNHAFFKEQWTLALPIVPLLVARMLPGLATTPLGSMVVTARGSRGYAAANGAWAAAEVAVALLCIYLIGVHGLAWSYSFMAWFGVIVFAVGSRMPALFKDVLRTLLLRPSIWVAFVLASAFQFFPASVRLNLTVALAYSAFVCLAAIASETCARELLKFQTLRRSRSG